MPKCGCPTKRGTKCKNKVRSKGQRCRWHLKQPSTCSICLEGISSDARRLVACQHTFHGECVGKWFVQCANHGDGSPTCPLCRSVVTDVPTLSWIEEQSPASDNSDGEWEPVDTWRRIAEHVQERREQSRRGLLQQIRGLYQRMLAR